MFSGRLIYTNLSAGLGVIINCLILPFDQALKYNISFNLLGSEEIQGDPVEKKYNRLLFFKKFLNYPDISEVTKFELRNLEIKPL